MNKTLESVTRGQCNARPTVTFLAVGHHRAFDWYQFITARAMLALQALY